MTNETLIKRDLNILSNEEGYKQGISGVEKFGFTNREVYKQYKDLFLNNERVVMTERASAKTFQLCLRLINDPNLVVVVSSQAERKHIKDKLEELLPTLHTAYEEKRQILLRVFTVEEWRNDKIDGRLPFRKTIHVENTEEVLKQLLGVHVSSLSTGFYSVYGYTHDFDKAKPVHYDFKH